MTTIRTRNIGIIIAILLVASVVLNAYTVVEKTNKPPVNDRIYELRTYTTDDGKLPDLLDRFKNGELQLLYKHGLVGVGHWIPTDRENTFIYIVSHNSQREAEKNWEAFMNDPEWQKIFEDSRVDGPIVINVESVFMKAADFSPIR